MLILRRGRRQVAIGERRRHQDSRRGAAGTAQQLPRKARRPLHLHRQESKQKCDNYIFFNIYIYIFYFVYVNKKTKT